MSILAPDSKAPPESAANGFRGLARRPRRLARTAARLLLACAVAAAPACASREGQPAPGQRSAPSDAALRILNYTASAVAVEVDGLALGEVPAGGDQLFDGLSAGTHDLRGVSLDGGLSFRRDLLPLQAGETFTWILREGGGGGPAVEEMVTGAGDATIVVENATPWDVEVLLNGQVLGVAASGGNAPFSGIVPGSYRLEARSPEASFPREYPVLEAGETFTWRLRAPAGTELEASGGLLPAPGTGRLRIENPHPVALTVLANGTQLGTVEAGRTRIFDELPAQRVLLAAETSDRGRRAAGPSTRIDPGRVTLWRIGPLGGADLRSVEPAPGEGEVGVGPPAAAQPFPDAELPPLPPAAPAPTPAAPGETGVAGDHTFVVENGTPQDLQILADEQVIGVVGAGMTERFTNLPALRFTPRAVSASGARGYDHPPVDLSSRSSFTWIILP